MSLDDAQDDELNLDAFGETPISESEDIFSDDSELLVSQELTEIDTAIDNDIFGTGNLDLSDNQDLTEISNLDNALNFDAFDESVSAQTEPELNLSDNSEDDDLDLGLDFGDETSQDDDFDLDALLEDDKK